MRTAITTGITKDGKTEIIHGPEVSFAEHIRHFHAHGDGESGYAKIQLWESRGMRQRKGGKEQGGVDFNAAHSIEQQQDKKKSHALPDLNPPLAKQDGKVNWDAARPVVAGPALPLAAAEGDALDDLTIDGLKEDYGDEVDLTGCTLKQDYIARIRAYEELDAANTVPQLKEIAATEEAAVTGDMKKADFINAILARRSKAA